ncbi:hypothetical protein [Desulfobacula phenolica]|uniref:MSHA biogenesis protein MshL n=1 Tax=Desulfobacula phenolica TaxID=90732 RepID=A0A1H2J0F1_9BACT|nr:hypothetical protein [Desulfobacula phenolica]SDU49883.1 MSHA biogenesis protein MshL [Desulfobacula phenolica]
MLKTVETRSKLKLKRNTALFFKIAISIMLSTLFSCSIVPEPAPPVTIDKPVIQSKSQSPAQEAVQFTAGELPALLEFSPDPVMDETRPFDSQLFSFSVRNTPLRDVFMGLAKQAKLNLVLGTNVNGAESVSVEFDNLPLRQALEEILQTFEYSYTINGNILRIKSVETRVMHFDYPLIYSTSTSSVGGDMLGSSGGEDGGSDISAEFTVETEIEDDESLNVWKQVKGMLTPRPEQGSQEGGSAGTSDGEITGMLSEMGSATVDSASGTIVVTDRPDILDRVENVLAQMNKSLKRQVIIEAKIMEVQLNHGHQYGVDWSAIRAGNTLGLDLSSGMAGNLNAGTGTFQLAMTNLADKWTYSAMIDAIATQGDVNTISSPRLNVINNQSATISIGRTIPYLDFEIQTVTAGDTVSYEAVPTVQRAQAGVSLGITPQIGEDGIITLSIVPVVTDQVGSEAFTYQGTSWTVPVLDTRTASTIISAMDGETIVLGGMIQDVTTDNRTRVPLLGNLPVVGNFLFGNQSKENSKVELVILLTPRIVKR